MGPNEIFSKEFVADGDVTINHIVKKGAQEDDLKMATTHSESLIGVAGHDAKDNERVRVVMIGIAKVKYGGTITQGDLLTANAQGEAVKATRHSHVENADATYTLGASTAIALDVRTIGVAMATGVDGDIGTVFLTPGMI